MTTTINASLSSGLVNTADTSGILQLQTANTAAVTIDASQRVGIGTTSPSVNLEVSGSSGQNIYVTYVGGSQARLKSDSGNSGVGTTGNTPFQIITNNTNRATFDTSGNMTMNTSNGGIIFNNSSALTNSTLNDYETGTWTPSVGGTATYTNQFGKYTKIGNIVYLQFEMTISSIGTGSVNIISGIPFTSATLSGGSGTNFGGFGYYAGLATNVYWIGIRIDSGGQTVIQNETVTSSSSTSNSATGIFTNGTRVLGSITYQANF
jgi:hypothetical protein